MKSKTLWLMCAMILAGCSTSVRNSIFNTTPFVDAQKNMQGDVILLDTPRMWIDWQELVSLYVADELANKSPPGGIASWNAHWLGMIDSNESRENAPKHITYIIESRRNADLPELEGYR